MNNEDLIYLVFYITDVLPPKHCYVSIYDNKPLIRRIKDSGCKNFKLALEYGIVADFPGANNITKVRFCYWDNNQLSSTLTEVDCNNVEILSYIVYVKNNDFVNNILSKHSTALRWNNKPLFINHF